MKQKRFLLLIILYFVGSFLFFLSGKNIKAQSSITTYVIPTMTNEKFLTTSTIPSGYISDQISIKASPGEFEPASFVVKANENINSLQVEATNLTGPGTITSDNVNIRVVKVWYQNGRNLLTPYFDKNVKILTPELLLKNDSLVKFENGENYLYLNGSWVWISQVSYESQLPVTIDGFPVQDSATLQPVNIAQEENKQFWVTLKVPTSTNAGNYTGQINLKVSGTIIKQLTLNLQVLPITLSVPSVTNNIYTYHQFQPSWPNGAIGCYAKNDTQYAAEVKDMIEHGIDNPIMYQNYTLGTSWIAHSLQLRINGGMYTAGQPLYYTGLAFAIIDAVTNQKPIADFIAQDIPKFQSVINLAQSYGINQVYFYGIDEAGADILALERPYWQAIHNIGGKIFVACSSGCFETVGDLLDYAIYPWSPDASRAAQWHSVGHKIGNYGNPQNGMEDPETYRRNFGLLLWQNDYDAATDFIYQSGFGHAWNDFDHTQYRDFHMSYPTVNGVISTIQAEGWREAYDDLRYVTTLKDLVNQGGGNTSYAINYLNYLKTVNLQQKSLDVIRSELISQILYLLGQGPVPYFCGDSTVNSGEECDTNNFSGKSCSTYGYSGGTLSCNADCTINRCACTPSSRSISFISPTDPNGATIFRNWTTVNTSISGENCSLSSFINWDNSLVGYWKFDEGSGSTAYDSSGNNLNGTLYGNPQWTTGRFGGALAFDGTAKYVKMPDSNLLDGLSAVTVEAWVYPNYGSENDNGIIADDWIGLRDSGWATFYLYDSNGNDSGYLGQEDLEDQGKWHHIAATYDKNQSGRNMKLYVDGKLTSSKAFSGTLRNGGLLFQISKPIGSATYWDGKIDEVKVWKRALSEDEIKASYNTGVYNLNHTFNNLADGTYQYYARAVDSVNAAQTETRSLTVNANCTNCNLSTPVITPSSPYDNQTFTISCSTNGSNYNCLNAYVDTNQCTFSNWSGNTAIFNCNPQTAGTHTAKCKSSTGTTQNCCSDEKTTAFTIQQSGTFSISFVSPTPDNGATINTTSTTIAASVSGAQEVSSFINWNQSLKGYWNLNDNSGQTALDQSTYGNNCTLTNGPTWTTGKFGSALNFDGNNDYLNCGTGTSLGIINELTLEAWVNFANATTSLNGVIAKRINGQCGYSIRIGTDFKPNFQTDYGHGQSYQIYYWAHAIPTSSVSYAYLAVTFSTTTGKVTTYFNGATDTIQTMTGDIFSCTTSPFYIGTYSGYYFPGIIDEVRIWNRVLSGQEIKASYNTGLYNLTNTFTNLINGTTYQYYARTSDLSGNTVQTETRALTVNTNPPPQNQPPVLDPIGNKTINEGSLLQFTVTATDPNGDTLTYSASNLPTGATFNVTTTHVFTWTPTYSQSGTYSNVCFQVSDGSLTDSECITITVNDITQPCTICGLGTPTVTPSSPLDNQSFTLTCPTNGNNYDCLNAYVDSTSCTFSNWSGNNAIFNCSAQSAGTHTAKCKSNTGTSQNCCSDEKSKSFTVQAVNDPPVLDSIGNKTVTEGSLLQFTLTASDPDGDTLTYSASNLPTGAAFNQTPHVFTWTPTYAQAGNYFNVCFQVSDGSLTDSECISITVNDSTQPCTICGLGTPTVAPFSPNDNQSFIITCPTNSSNYDCINAYANGTQCTFSNWSGNNALFNCPIKSGGVHTAKCKSLPGTSQNCCSDEKTKSFTIQTTTLPTSPSTPSGGGGGGYTPPSQPSSSTTTTPTTKKMTIAELRAKIAELIALIAKLQAQLAQMRGEVIPQNYQFTKDLSYGQKNNDIKYLQIFLKNQGKDIYSEGLITGYYGNLTKVAIIKFQLKYKIIISSSDLEAGKFNLQTRTKVNETLGK